MFNQMSLNDADARALKHYEKPSAVRVQDQSVVRFYAAMDFLSDHIEPSFEGEQEVVCLTEKGRRAVEEVIPSKKGLLYRIFHTPSYA